jgi:hypothetical protein
MPMYMAKFVCSITIGSSMMPSAISTLLITPLFLRMPIHAYTRRRKEVQNGSITSSSRRFRHARGLRAIP